MNNDNLNNSFNEEALLNDVNNDPPLAAIRVGGNDEQDGPGEENVFDEQISIQDLVQWIEGLARSIQDRDNVLFERITTLEQNSSRGSQSTTASNANARPGNNRFGVTLDRNGGNPALNEVSANGNSPSYSNLTAPSAVNSNPLGPRADSRHGDKSPSNENMNSAPNNTTGPYADKHNRGRTEHLNYSPSRRNSESGVSYHRDDRYRKKHQ